MTGPRRPTRAGPDGPTPGSPADLQVEADPEQVARTILLRRLTAAPRTRAELSADLARRGVPDDVAGRLLDRFTEVGLIDDCAYAEAWVESRHAGRGLGRRALAAELQRKGVEPEVVRDAVARVSDEAERERAAELVRRRLPSLAGLDRAVAARRLMGMLARRGYPPGVCAAVVSAALREDRGREDLDRADRDVGAGPSAVDADDAWS